MNCLYPASHYDTYMDYCLHKKTAVFDAYINFIREGNYIGGRGDGKG